MTNFVVHPDGTVDYPDTGCYTMSAEEFAAADTQRAWSEAEPPPEPQPYYEPHHYEPHPDEPPHHDWARVLKLSAIAAVALGVVAVVAVLRSWPRPPATPRGSYAAWRARRRLWVSSVSPRGPANTSRVCGRGVALLTRPKPKTKQRKNVDLEGPSL